MKYLNCHPLINIKNHQFWILGIGAGLITIFLTITWKSGDISQLSMSLLFLFAVGSLLWQKRHTFILRSGILSSFLGIFLIAFILYQSVSLPHQSKSLEAFIRLSPFISAIALGLLASGFKGLKQYWQEITILFFLGVPELILSSLINLAPLTAKFSTLLLWYSGIDVFIKEDIYINTAAGTIKVIYGCSGLNISTYLLGLAVIALLMFPIEAKKRIYVPIVAVILAFILNGIRIAILAVLVTNKQAFNYWHVGEGSRLFAMGAVFMLGLFYFFLLSNSKGKNQRNTES